MFTDKVELKDFEKMDPEYQELLKRVLAIQADCEIGGPHLYVETMLPAAPTKLDQLIVARTAAEEIDHYRKMARLAGDIGADVSYVLSWPNQKRYVESFRGKIETWEDFAVFGFLIDRVGRYQLEEFIGCSYAPLERILPDIITEEEGHIDFGTTKTAEMAARGGEWKEKAQRAVNFWFIKALDMFGRSESRRSERYRYWGLKRRTNAQAREDYVNEVTPLIEKFGLEVPDPNEGRAYQ
ncbi:MAG: phenylacetate-CoA oxygenase subunit PaaI [Deltaproteobacteria bacterium]|nr:phenylacetate-CoA oxygenase subunit PaaI [Deltaproteobacteria bacterium]